MVGEAVEQVVIILASPKVGADFESLSEITVSFGRVFGA